MTVNSQQEAIISELKEMMYSPFGLFLLFIVIGLLLFVNGLTFPDSSYNFLGETKRAELTSGAPITQNFTAKKDRLERIKIALGDDVLLPSESLRFSLLDSSCTRELATEKRTALAWPSSIFTNFDFPAIADSQGKTYCLSVLYESPYKRKDRPYIAASEDEQFTGWSYTDQGKNRTYKNRTLQIRPSYGEENLWSRLVQLENRLSQYKPEMFKGKILLLAASAIVLSLVLALYLIHFTEWKGDDR